MQVEQKALTISIIVAAMAILILSLVRPFNVHAQYYQPGTTSKSIVVDKKVRAVNETDYVDNLSSSQKVFSNNDLVEFSVTIQNSGKDTLTNINVTDTLPKYLSLIFNPGTYNSNKNDVEWTIDSLNPGESKTFLIRGKITGASVLTSAIQVSNIAEANSNGVSDRDEASYFVGIRTVPKTGSTDILIKTILILSVGGSSLYLRRLARGY